MKAPNKHTVEMANKFYNEAELMIGKCHPNFGDVYSICRAHKGYCDVVTIFYQNRKHQCHKVVSLVEGELEYDMELDY